MVGTTDGAATLQARTRHGEVTDEGDCGDGSGCGKGRGEAGAAARAAGEPLEFELGSRKIRVNSLDPGMVETDGLRASGMNHGAFREQMERQTPLGRIVQREDIALAATFLASDDSRWITGQVIVTAGGRRM